MSDHHLIVGGQRCGKSRHAERLALQWLAASPDHRVTVVATATAWDEEMHVRIARHQAERPAGMDTLEEPLRLAEALREAAQPGRLLLVDCLTLWLTNWLMPADGRSDAGAWAQARQDLLDTLDALPSPVVFVSNEVGWGVIPLSAEVRQYVDELGWLNQAVARRCARLTLMVAGQPWTRVVSETSEET